MLLHNVRGPTSFESLKTVNGQVHETYQAACVALRLLENDNHWDQTLEEAVVFEITHNLRNLFVIILGFCYVTEPIQLWLKYRDEMSEDVLYRSRKYNDDNELVFNDEIYNEALILIEDQLFSITGKTLKEFSFTPPLRSNRISLLGSHHRETNFNLEVLLNLINEDEPKLTDEQRNVCNKILDSVNRKQGKIFFLDVPDGTGKTFLLNLLLAKIRVSGNIALAVASSGIAATLLAGGRTAYSLFKLPLNLNADESPICNISKQSDAAKLFKECSVIVWDECTMAHKRAIEALNRTIEDIRNDQRDMGGIAFVLGVFRQTLPVVKRGTRANEINACLKSSCLWPKFNLLSLSKNIRVHLFGDLTAREFSSTLLKIGNGNIEEVNGKIQIPTDVGTIVSTLEDLTKNNYPDVKNLKFKPISWLSERSILTSMNVHASRINDLILSLYDDVEMIYSSIDNVVDQDDATNFPVEFLNSLNPAGMPTHILKLKIGAPIMLMRNLSSPKLCNGTRLQVMSLKQNIIKAKIITGCGIGDIVFILRISIISTDYEFQYKRIQFPVRVYFAITINKSQGQTLKIAGVDLSTECFSHGQLYVAFSRVGKTKNLFILKKKRNNT